MKIRSHRSYLVSTAALVWLAVNFEGVAQQPQAPVPQSPAGQVQTPPSQAPPQGRRGGGGGRKDDPVNADVDWTINDGILEIECGDGSRIIVNRHVGNRELWVAAKSGGFHYRPSDGRWHDTRSGDELGATLARILKAQAGLAVTLPPLVAPTL